MKLNLGCGQNMLDGYVNIDKYDTFKPDVVWDLEVTPWPFEANSVTEIQAKHVLEHIGADTDVFLTIIKEIYRVMAPDAVLDIRVPHHMANGYWGDPTHVRAINENVMSLFSKENCRMFAEKGWPNTPLADYLDVDLKIDHMEYGLSAYWAQKRQQGMPDDELEFAARSYANVLDEIRLVMKKVA